MIRTVLAAAILVAGFGLDVRAQVVRDAKPRTAAPDTPAFAGVIAGQVASADAGRAIRRAEVTVTGGTPKTTKTAMTDDQGAFRITGLPPGDYELVAGMYDLANYARRLPVTGEGGDRLLDDVIPLGVVSVEVP